MRFDVWCSDDGWNVDQDGATVAQRLGRDQAVDLAAHLAAAGQLTELVVHEPDAQHLENSDGEPVSPSRSASLS